MPTSNKGRQKKKVLLICFAKFPMLHFLSDRKENLTDNNSLTNTSISSIALCQLTDLNSGQILPHIAFDKCL